MRFLSLGLAAVVVSGCSPAITFRVDVDESASAGTLTLNNQSANLELSADGTFVGRWNGSDASGKIEITFPDGSKTQCLVGYVTHGMIEVQRFSIKKRQCVQV